MLDTTIPPRRLGRALRAARRALGLRRQVAAARLGVTPRVLVAWERGEERVPSSMAIALTDLYGSHLTDRVPDRDPARVEFGTLVLGEHVRVQAATAAEEMLGDYVEILRTVRDAKPGEPIPLRAADLEALAAALGENTDDIDARIVELVRCTPEQATLLHHELVRRRVLVPAAGLAIGVAAIAGVAMVAEHPGASRPPLQTENVARHTPSAGSAGTPSSTTTPSTTTPSTTPSTAAPATTAPATTAPATATPTTTTPTTAPATAPATAAATTPPTDDPIVGIPPGETHTIIAP